MTKAQLVRYENRREEIKTLLSDVERKLGAMREILDASIAAAADPAQKDHEEHALMYLRATDGSVDSAQLLIIDTRIETLKLGAAQ